jgi:hypothetical protein
MIPQIAIAQDAGRDILSFGARNDTTYDYTFAAASNLYNEYCESDHLQAGKSLSAGADVSNVDICADKTVDLVN